LIGHVVYFTKKITSDKVVEELDAVCSAFENAEHHASRLHGI